MRKLTKKEGLLGLTPLELDSPYSAMLPCGSIYQANKNFMELLTYVPDKEVFRYEDEYLIADSYTECRIEEHFITIYFKVKHFLTNEFGNMYIPRIGLVENTMYMSVFFKLKNKGVFSCIVSSLEGMEAMLNNSSVQYVPPVKYLFVIDEITPDSLHLFFSDISSKEKWWLDEHLLAHKKENIAFQERLGIID